MPTDTAIIISVIAALFVFFAAVLIYGDMTWNRYSGDKRRRRD